MGSPQFAVPSLQHLLAAHYTIVGVYCQPDSPAGRGRRLLPPPVKQAALDLGLPVFQPQSLRNREAVEELAGLKPDLIVVAAFGQILRPAVLQIPPHGVLNVHASLLPRHRGASPVVGAILDGCEQTGATIMLIDEGLDTGPILAQRPEPIQPEDTAGALSERLATVGAELLVETIPRWLSGLIVPEPQDASRATVTHQITKEAGLLNWNLPAEQLWRRVRALNPWPSTYTTLDGVQVRILQAWLVPNEQGQSGAITHFKSTLPLARGLPAPAFAVGTGSGLLLPLILQKAGRRSLTAVDFANGERGLIGRRFG
ncbi:MAG: methionyl-tRNA formyltransferase [Dehalococcoidia bacterium]